MCRSPSTMRASFPTKALPRRCPIRNGRRRSTPWSATCVRARSRQDLPRRLSAVGRYSQPTPRLTARRTSCPIGFTSCRCAGSSIPALRMSRRLDRNFSGRLSSSRHVRQKRRSAAMAQEQDQEQGQEPGQEQAAPSGPDLTKGVTFADFVDGKLLGHVGTAEVLLIRSGAEVFAIGPHCTHYHGPLADGLVVGESVRCPWHHACFDLRTGEALRAPALSPVACWQVVERDGRIFVAEKREQPKPRGDSATAQAPKRIVIVGGGAAGFAAAEMLRRCSYQGAIVMLSADPAPPVDRPNLSKDYLAGSAPEDWLPLRPDDFYADKGIELRLGGDVAGIDCTRREIQLAGSASIAYDRLLRATGAEPVRLSVPGTDQA